MATRDQSVGRSLPATGPLPIAAVVLTYNEALNIERCLESIEGWCREIYIVDSGSNDGTLTVCKRYTNTIYEHPFVDSASQWNWAFTNLPIESPWVFVLDSDHKVTRELWHDIAKVIAADENEITGYYSRHQYFFWGQRIRGFKPYGLRIFRRGCAKADSSEFVDMRFLVDGRVATLPGCVLEHNEKEASIDFWIDKHQKFASRMAVEQVLRTHGRIGWQVEPRLFGNPDQRIVWLKNRWYRMPLYVRPFPYFFYRYFIRLGVFDGWKGAVFHFLHAFWFRLLIDIHIGRLETDLAHGRASIEQLEAFGRPPAL